ncbi:MAG: MFS transporter [Methanobacteriaceae archaeon]|nr:MFS transporter [Methanobacteriaceae archaeon]
MSISNKNYALLVAVMAAFLTPFVGSSINIALPPIGMEFGADAVLLGWINTIYLLTLAVFLIPLGRIADIHGRKRIFTYGIILFTISSLLAAFSSSLEMLMVLRVLQGASSAMIFGNLFAIIASLFPDGERGKALGITVTGAFMGLFLGPVLGGILTQYLGWRSIFFFNVPLGILTTLAVFRLKGEWAEGSGEKFDLVGSVVLGGSLTVLIYGLAQLPENFGYYLILMGLIGLGTFFYMEGRIKSPVLDVKIFKNRSFTLHNLAAFISYSAGVPIVFLLSLYLQFVKGMGPQSAGLILAVQPVMMAIFSPLAGMLSDKIEPYRVAGLGMGLTTLGLAGLTFLGEDTNLGLVVVCLVALGMGFALFSSPNTNVIMGSVESRLYGAASATLSSIRVLGQMSGMAVAILVLNIVMGSAIISPENYSSFIYSSQLSFALFAGTAFIGMILSLSGKKSVDDLFKKLLFCE